MLVTSIFDAFAYSRSDAHTVTVRGQCCQRRFARPSTLDRVPYPMLAFHLQMPKRHVSQQADRHVWSLEKYANENTQRFFAQNLASISKHNRSSFPMCIEA